MAESPGRRRWTWRRIFGSTLLVVAGILAWAFCDRVAAPLGQALLFAAALGALLAALRPHYGAALLVAAVMLLGTARGVRHVNAWNLLFIPVFAGGAFHLLRRRPQLAWIAASFPFWAMSEAIPGSIYVALGFVLIGLVVLGIRPLLPGPRFSGGKPLPHLAGGALIEVPARVYEFKKGRGALKILTALCTAGLVAGAILATMRSPAAGITLLLVSGLMATVFGFSFWFSGRMRYRIDAEGLHSRVLFREATIRWSEIERLSLRYVFLPGYSLRFVYYCVRSPAREFNFPNTLRGAGELRDLIARATGLEWPEPSFEPSTF
jgi:hypothetical protein